MYSFLVNEIQCITKHKPNILIFIKDDIPGTEERLLHTSYNARENPLIIVSYKASESTTNICCANGKSKYTACFN